MGTISYLAAISISLFLLFFTYFLESLNLCSQGSILGFIELSSESFIAIQLIRSYLNGRSSQKRYLLFIGVAFLSLLFADTFYLYFYYFKKLSGSLSYVVFLTKLPYLICYSILIIALVNELKGSSKNKFYYLVLSISFFFTLVLELRFIILPFFEQAPKVSNYFVSIGDFLNIITLFILCNLSILIFVFSRQLSWSIFGVGLLILALGDWALRVETLMGQTPKFGIYEFMWALGVIVSGIPVALTDFSDRLSTTIGVKSIVRNYKIFTGFLGFIAILFLCLSKDDNLDAIKILSFGMCLVMLFSTLVAHRLIEVISFFSVELAKKVEFTKETKNKILPIELYELFQNIFLERIVLRNKLQERENDILISEMKYHVAAQVAHDIRSPLSALDSILDDLAVLPEDVRQIARSAVTRINDIANNLLEKNRSMRADEKVESQFELGQEQSVFWLPVLIESIISEKRAEVKDRRSVNIEFELDESLFDSFIQVEASNFKRVLSNLLNNSLEALDKNSGKILVSVSDGGHSWLIDLMDNGKGIARENLPFIFDSGKSFGKADGHGLGLYHARKVMESYQGIMTIQSEEGEGTTVSMSFPKAAAPHWFLSHLNLVPKATIIILDDDESIHRVWVRRLEDFSRANQIELQIMNFMNGSDLATWYKINFHQVDNRYLTCLFDYELLGQDMNGVDLSVALGLTANTILVTSHFENEYLLEKVSSLGIRMIPKSYVSYIKFILQKDSSPLPGV